jgi:hypothetical protein
MLDRLFHRAPKIGDRAIIQEGPFTGRNGLITAVRGTPPRYEVTIDECCRAELEAGELIVARRTFFGALNVAAERREHSRIGGISRVQLPAASVLLSEIRTAMDGDEHASSIASDIGARARERRENTPADAAD